MLFRLLSEEMHIDQDRSISIMSRFTFNSLSLFLYWTTFFIYHGVSRIILWVIFIRSFTFINGNCITNAMPSHIVLSFQILVFYSCSLPEMLMVFTIFKDFEIYWNVNDAWAVTLLWFPICRKIKQFQGLFVFLVICGRGSA